MRINKFLSEIGYCSRREADRLIEAGKIKINGVLAKVGDQVTEEDVIFVNGKEIKNKKEKNIILLLNKPKKIVCTTVSQGNDTNVVDFINYKTRVYPIGRLDKDSRGLILLTNNGDIVNKIMKAQNFHEKEYIVKVNKKITKDFISKMSKGVPVLGQITRKCKVVQINDNTFNIVLTQGLNRQIRRMCEYFGYEVIDLKRVRIMNLSLRGIEEGKYREIKSSELKELMKLLKGEK